MPPAILSVVLGEDFASLKQEMYNYGDYEGDVVALDESGGASVLQSLKDEPVRF